MGIRTIHEKKLLSHCKNLAGRTEWDRQIVNIFAPQAHYYVINEILRPIFYLSQNGNTNSAHKLKLLVQYLKIHIKDST